MKVYKFGDTDICYILIIEEDDGILKVAMLNKESIIEYVASPVKLTNGVVRLNFGSGSSMPYKNADGSLCKKLHEIK